MSYGENTRLILSSLASLAAGYGLHVLQARGDKQARKEAAESARKARIREFTGFMSGFRSWVERSSFGDRGEQFHDRVNLFREAEGKVRDDVPAQSKTAFSDAVTALCRLHIGEVVEYDTFTDAGGQAQIKDIGRDRLAGAIDAVTKTLE